MADLTKCPKCGIEYDSSKIHVCSVGDDLEKAYFGSESQETVGDTGER